MSEERMIRVELGAKERIDGMLWVQDEWGHRREIDIYDTEPAPSKDFKPKCHDELDTRKDSNGHWKYDIYKCVSCDIREQCIYKRD